MDKCMIQRNRTDLVDVFNKFASLNNREFRMSASNLVDVLQFAKGLEKNILLTRNFNELSKADIALGSSRLRRKGLASRRVIDMWLAPTGARGELGKTYRLILMLGYVLFRSNMWKRNTKMRLCRYATTDEAAARDRKVLKEFLREARIECEVDVMVMAGWPGLDNDLVAKCENSQLSVLEECTLLNQCIKAKIEREGKTSVVFAPLPALSRSKNFDLFRADYHESDFAEKSKTDSEDDDEEQGRSSDINEKWMSMVNLLSEGLPPTVLVAAQENVMPDGNFYGLKEFSKEMGTAVSRTF
eukprot:TRINITY_DN20702_c0_g1_i1.p1 TRINITY_DN20702_c0_g1~~TRINITY_DN20702_c0_g1_i1.p1  ORF type:complete len:300 (+),score=55.43 TRINITY_DN20702_c0_g1_i1:120-1019(+)